MTTVSEQFFDCLCRTCMHELTETPAFDATNNTYQQWQSIFDTIEECGELRIAQLLSVTIPQIVEVQLSDELPKKICSCCLQQLQVVYRFQQMCTQSDQQMRALIAARSTTCASAKNYIDANKALKHKSLLEVHQQTIEFESVPTLPEPVQVLAVDPLQNIEVLMEHSADSVDDGGTYVKNEPCYGESDSDGEALSPPIAAKSKMCIIKKLENQAGVEDGRTQSFKRKKTVKKMSKHVCDLCEGTFSTSSSLHRHKRRYHSIVKPKKALKKLPCDQCEETYNTHAKLEKHKQLQHSSEAVDIKIPAENKVLKATEEEREMLVDEQKQSLPTEEIDKKLITETEEQQERISSCFSDGQIQIADNENMDNKLILPTEEEKERLSDRHTQSLQNEEIENKLIVETEKQQEILDTDQTQVSHNEKSNKMPRNICGICENPFSTLSSLRRHIKRYHSMEKPKRALKQRTGALSNDVKPKLVRPRKKLKKEKVIKQYSCNLCDKTYKNSEALKIHIRKHTGERPYLCPECGKSFSDPSNLKQHILRHGEEKPFECPYCPLKFRCPNYVAQHKMIHEGIKRHVCDICGASFTKTCQLAVHKRYHNNDKPFKCEYCEMRFVRKSAQRVHMRTHTGEKPYECKYCDRAFAQSGDHIKHLRTHLGDNVYSCELCPLTFRLASELRLHFATHKNDVPNVPQLNMNALKQEQASFLLPFSEPANLSQEQVETKTTE